MLANQLYGPYGTSRYSGGSMAPYSDKGYTGQYADALTGLNYYNARYYDPTVGVFLSADTVQGNVQGMNPYAYVGGNPETNSDPTGKYYSTSGSIGNGGSIGYVNPASGNITTVSNNGNGGYRWVDGSYSYNYGSMEVNTFTSQQQARYGSYNPNTDPNNSPAAKLAQVTGWNDLQQTWNDPTATGWDKAWAVGRFIGTNLNNAAQLAMIFGGPEGETLDGGVAALDEGATLAEHEGSAAVDEAVSACGGLSFTPTTPVTTDHGKQAIGTMHVGEKVLAYNPTTHKMELEPVLHIWINHDNDLVNLTLTTSTHAPHSTVVSTKSEVIHTNKKHPFLTKEQGFLPVAQITLGMHILRADGTYGVVTDWQVVSGVKAMYNLEVAQDHTFTVGVGQWVVHNCGGVDGGGDRQGFANQDLLNNHFDKHNAEFTPSFANPSDYENTAVDFMNEPERDGLHEGIRSRDNATIRVDDSTGWFGVMRNGNINTFFIPDPARNGGFSPVDYFLNQIDDLIF